MRLGFKSMVKAGKVAALVLQLYLVCIFSLHRRPLKERLDYTHAWSSLILKAFGIALVIDPQIDQATSQPSSFLYVSNHLSWVDIVVIQAHTPCLFVSKKEVGSWPILGKIAKSCGVIFVERESKKSMLDCIQAVADHLKSGISVVVFPERTSSPGFDRHVFQSNFFESAIRAQSHVMPVSLSYRDAISGDNCASIPYYGNMSFADSMLRVIQTKPTQAHLRVFDSVSHQGHSRKSLTRVSENCINDFRHPIEFLENVQRPGAC